MRNRTALRIWLETAAAIASAVATALTALWPQWIEMVFGADPDGGTGETEWLLVACLFAVTLALTLDLGREWRRAGAAKSVG